MCFVIQFVVVLPKLDVGFESRSGAHRRPVYFLPIYHWFETEPAVWGPGRFRKCPTHNAPHGRSTGSTRQISGWKRLLPRLATLPHRTVRLHRTSGDQADLMVPTKAPDGTIISCPDAIIAASHL